MGYLAEDHSWVSDERAGEDSERRRIARATLEMNSRWSRPIEQATAGERDPQRKAARQVFELEREVDPTQVQAVLALGRQGHDEDPQDASSRTAGMIDELAGEADDRLEEINDRGRDEDTATYSAWLQWAHGLTLEQLEQQLEGLDTEDRNQVLIMLEQEYEEDLAAYYDEDDEDEYEETKPTRAATSTRTSTTKATKASTPTPAPRRTMVPGGNAHLSDRLPPRAYPPPRRCSSHACTTGAQALPGRYVCGPCAERLRVLADTLRRRHG